MKRFSMKKGLILLVVLAMMFALAAPTLAATADTTHTVTIYVQEATRNDSGKVTDQDVYNEDDPIVVTVNDGQTLKDAINAACEQENSIITNPVWKPTDDQYLISIEVDGKPLKNVDTYLDNTPAPGQTTYKGLSWMYFNGTPSQMPASSYAYPDVSLGNAKVTTNTIITLSFEDLTYIW